MIIKQIRELHTEKSASLHLAALLRHKEGKEDSWGCPNCNSHASYHPKNFDLTLLFRKHWHLAFAQFTIVICKREVAVHGRPHIWVEGPWHKLFCGAISRAIRTLHKHCRHVVR